MGSILCGAIISGVCYKEIPGYPFPVEYLVVAGGGAAGGGGGFLTGCTSLGSEVYTITVGAGGSLVTGIGSNSSICSSTTNIICTTGGGSGLIGAGSPGGSGSGAYTWPAPRAGCAGNTPNITTARLPWWL